MRLNPQVLVRRVPGAVLATLPAPTYTELPAVVRITGSALAVFDELASEPTHAELVAALVRRYDVAAARVEADIAALLDEWRATGFLDDAS